MGNSFPNRELFSVFITYLSGATPQKHVKINNLPYWHGFCISIPRRFTGAALNFNFNPAGKRDDNHSIFNRRRYSMPRINFNAPAMMNVNRLDVLEKGLMRSLQRVSSGVRITRPADDVAAHGVAEHLRGQIRSKAMASRNVQDGIALINVAEGALNEVDSILHRMRELSVQSANGTYNDNDRGHLQLELDTLKDEINFISESTHYNGHKLLNGTGDWGTGKGGYFQIDANNVPNNDFLSHKIPPVNTTSLGIDHDEMRIDSQVSAAEGIDKIRNAVDYINHVRATLGGVANRLEHSWKNTEKMIEENQAYESLLRDTDVPEEMISVTRDQIVSQYCTAMLAQANQTPNTILQLLSK